MVIPLILILKTTLAAVIDKAKSRFLTFKAKSEFTQLGQAFTKAPIFCSFDLEYHIQIEPNALGYGISVVLS